MKALLTKIINSCNNLIQAIITDDKAVWPNVKLNNKNIFDPFKQRLAFVPQKINGQSITNVPKSKTSQW